MLYNTNYCITTTYYRNNNNNEYAASKQKQERINRRDNGKAGNIKKRRFTAVVNEYNERVRVRIRVNSILIGNR